MRIKIIILSSFIFCLSINAQMRFKYLTTDIGLSDYRIHAIYRDSRDFLWIGSSNKGLNRYDGNSVVVYTKNEKYPGNLSNNDVSCIFEDSRKKLWFGTMNGLNLFDPKTEKFTVFNNNYADSIPNGNVVRCIFEDRDGNLWVTYDNGGGLNKFDYESNSFIHYKVDEPDNKMNANSIHSIKQDSKGRLWIGTRAPGLYRFDLERKTFIPYCQKTIDAGENSLKTLFIDNRDIIWIGSFGMGLYSYDSDNEELLHFKSNGGNNGVNNPFISTIIQFDEKHLLIGTDQGGLNMYNFESKTFEYIVEDITQINGLNNNGIKCLHKDKEGILWVGTSRGGVNFFNPKQSKFKLFENNINNPNSLSYNIVGCFFEDSDGIIWIGTDGGGLNMFDPVTGKFSVYRYDPSDPNSISGDVIRCIAEDKDKNLWIGTWGAGLNRFNRKTGRFYHYFTEDNNPSSISSNTIWHMHFDHNNKLWLANFNHGIEIFDENKGVVTRFKADPHNPNSLNSNDARYIYEDRQHNIFICTTNGINLYDSISASFKSYNMFPDNYTWVICEDKKNRLWAGSINKGLFQFNREGEILEVYNVSNGLPDNKILAILEDEKGFLWISTNNGICQIDPESKEIKKYNKSDGLQGNTFFEQSFLKTSQGEMFFGGYNGFNSFFPDSIQHNDFIPRVYITEFKIFNKNVIHGTIDSPLKQHITETHELTISWRNSVFSFEFVGINYTHPEKNQYAYIMEGFESEWNYVGNKRDVTYTNMDPGDYTFKVIASNNDGVWNNDGTSIKITILPPWWKTVWFKILFILSLLYLIYWVINYRTSQLRKQKLQLANMVKERTIQLEDVNAELEEKQEEIYMQNEELQVQKETLQEANGTLEKQTKEIESKNIELNQHRNHLEKLVEDRTSELVTVLKKVEESDKLKSAFLSNMSHEIRTPMNAIVGFSALLCDSDLPEDEKETFIASIKKNSEALLVLINDILEMSQIQTNQLAINNHPANIIDLLKELMESFNIQINQQRIQLILETGEFNNKLICSVDPYRLKQILSNLLSNALKFTDKGFIKVGITKQTEGFITFFVQDTGIGIPENSGNSIFERFLKVESTHSKFYKGVGLGLAISYSLVQAMGGKIWYKSKLDSGTTFYFTIPHLEEKIEELPKKRDNQNIPDLFDKEILIVEDNEANYKLLSCYIAKTKANVTWAVNGVEALESAKEKNFDLILMDLKLPVMDGLEATDLIRKINPEQLIVAQTAFAFKEEKNKFLKFGFNGYLEKPIIMERLIEVLNEIFKD